MTTEVGGATKEDLFSEYIHWALENSIWNGIPIAWQKGNQFQSDVARKITSLLFSNDLDSIDERFVLNDVPLDSHHLPNYIAHICGINNSEIEAQENIDYLKNLYPGIEVDLISNKSHGVLVDGMEVLFLNYAGISPNTGETLRKYWGRFHEQNKDFPDAKILQFCHSQGTIHVKNQLDKSSQEIRDRVIVVAIAPAALFPEGIAADVTRYASKRDFVPHLEVFLRSITDFPDDGISESTKAAWANQDLVITLDPHPEAPFFDHSFQSPTFQEVIIKSIDKYLKSSTGSEQESK